MFALSLPASELLGDANQGTEEIRDPGAAARARVYGALAQIFRGPVPGQADEGLLGQWCARIAESATSLPYEFDVAAPPDPGTEEEYSRLFLGGAPEAALVLAGAHFDDRAQTIQEVRKYYEHFGQVADENPDPPLDHLATECAFLQEVARRESTASSDRSLLILRRAELAFLERHLAVWVPKLVEAATAEQPDAFFAWALDVLARFVPADLAYVKALLNA